MKFSYIGFVTIEANKNILELIATEIIGKSE